MQMPSWLRAPSIHQIGRLLQSKRMRPATIVLALFFLIPVTALAQGSPFDTGFTAIQNLFTGTIAKVASLVAIVIGGYGFAHGEPGAKKALAGVAAGTGIATPISTNAERVPYAKQHRSETSHKSSLQKHA